MKVEYSREVTVDAAALWQVLTAVERYPIVLGSVAQAERLEGEGFGPGVKWREGRRALGRVTVGSVTVLDAVEGESARLLFEMEGAEFVMSYRLDPTPAGVTFAIASEVDNDLGRGVAGFLQRVFGGVSPKIMREVLKRDHADFVAAARPRD